MGDIDLIGLYIAHLRALGRGSLRSIESSLRSMDRELPCGLEVACQDEIVALLGRQRPDGEPVWSQGTRSNYRIRIGSFFAWAVRTGRLDWDPIADLPTPRVPRGRPKPWTEHELLTIASQTSGWLQLAITLASWAGLRCCEIVALCSEDVTDKTLTVWRGKGGRSRVIPTHPRVWRAVADLPGGPAIEATGGRSDASWLSRTARYHIERLGVRPGGLHRGRHRLASRMLAEGASIRHVQEVLGHASLQSTQVYTEVPMADLTMWVQALPDVGPAGPTDQAMRRGRRTGSGADGVDGAASPAAASSAETSP
jgi:integrase